MNKTAIKNFAIEARKSLIAMAVSRAGILGITADAITSPSQTGQGFQVYPTHFGTETTLTGKEVQSRSRLVTEITDKGFEQVMEEVAYTWFNRLIAIRFMEVNDYLPSRVRVLSSETAGKLEPDLVTRAPSDVEMDFTSAEIDAIYAMKDDPRRSGELFRTLFIKQCNLLGDILPNLFEKTADYTELLLDIAWDKEDGVVRSLLGIDEGDFLEAVEIVGWMYQYYNTEPKAKVFSRASGSKISKEELPAATQLFTPDWIVRYMVENSLGRTVLHNLQYDIWMPEEKAKIPALKEKWKYYLDATTQTDEIEGEYAFEEHHRYANDAILPFVDATFMDPCMGSGHILVYAFDVFMDIYTVQGWTERDAAQRILEKNLYGFDIDQRAYQLTYFALMMKARSYDRRFFTRGIQPHVYTIMETNSLGGSYKLAMGDFLLSKEHQDTLNYLLDAFIDAKEYGSILRLEDRDYEGLWEAWKYTASQTASNFNISMWYSAVEHEIPKIIQQAIMLTQKYDVVVTNPPYMAVSNASSKLQNYVKNNFADSKGDLFAVFIERCLQMTIAEGYTAMITQHAWMFLSSYEKLRAKLEHIDIINMAHLGPRAFEEISGEVVQTTSWVMQNRNSKGYRGTYARLVDFNSQQGKEDAFLTSEHLHTAQQENFEKIPGSPIAYWVSERMLRAFEDGENLGDIAYPKTGMTTGDNNRFLRLWNEVVNHKIMFDAGNAQEAIHSQAKWFPYCKGGGYKRWYGFNEYVVNWENNGFEIKNNIKDNGLKAASVRSEPLYFRDLITWSAVTSGKFSCRVVDKGFLFDSGGSSISVTANKLYLLALLNGIVGQYCLDISNATINYQPGDIAGIPVLKNAVCLVEDITTHNIALSRTDWDSFETSWDFQRHPLAPSAMATKEQLDSQFTTTRMEKFGQLAWHFDRWNEECTNRFNQLKANEEELNRIFIDIYGLQDELTPEVEDKDVTVRRADLTREVKSLISYAVGCMFGRYSLDVDGLAYAGGDWDSSKYTTFTPDSDNVLPITDTGYFEDDIVTRLVEFVRVVYGADTLDENLDFIAAALGNKGATSREVIRNYFLKDFYKDHVKTYQKRPIYWLFDSGKQDGFKALIYLHRYDADTPGRVRTDYLHKQQGFLESAIERCDYTLLQESANPRDKAKATKEKDKLIKQLAETRIYDQALAHIALQRLPLDLDDGVKVNYAKFQGIEVAREGQKTVKIDLLGKI